MKTSTRRLSITHIIVSNVSRAVKALKQQVDYLLVFFWCVVKTQKHVMEPPHSLDLSSLTRDKRSQRLPVISRLLWDALATDGKHFFQSENLLKELRSWHVTEGLHSLVSWEWSSSEETQRKQCAQTVLSPAALSSTRPHTARGCGSAEVPLRQEATPVHLKDTDTHRCSLLFKLSENVHDSSHKLSNYDGFSGCFFITGKRIGTYNSWFLLLQDNQSSIMYIFIS